MQDEAVRIGCTVADAETLDNGALPRGQTRFYVVFYVLLVFVASYATAELGVPASVTLTGVAIGSITVVVAPIVGALSDRIGRKPPIVTGALLVAAMVIPFFHLLSTGQPALIYAAFALAFLGLAIYFGPLTTFAAELFPTRIRYSAAALAASLVVSVACAVALRETKDVEMDADGGDTAGAQPVAGVMVADRGRTSRADVSATRRPIRPR